MFYSWLSTMIAILNKNTFIILDVDHLDPRPGTRDLDRDTDQHRPKFNRLFLGRRPLHKFYRKIFFKNSCIQTLIRAQAPWLGITIRIATKI